MTYTSTYPDISVPDTLLTPYVMRHATRLAASPALIEGATGRTITYGELLASIKALAGGLTARGFGTGDVIALLAPNIPEYAVALHGAAWAGCTVTTINPTYTDREIHHQLTDSGARLLITVSPLAELATAGAESTKVESVVTIDPSGGESLADLMGEPLDSHVELPTDSVVCLPYSSGTTGLAKGVMLTHRNLVANHEQVAAILPFQEGEAIISFLPFFHIYGLSVLLNGSLAAGATVICMPRFDLPEFLGLAQQYKVKRALVVPPVVLALAKHPLVDEYDLSNLEQVFSGAAPLGAELAAEAEARLKCEVAQGYGMTELSPVTHVSPLGGARPGTVGLLVSSTEARIVNPETGEDSGADGEGELWIRGPQVMPGYLNNAKATAETIDSEGWLHTGDVATVDADGYFSIVDRVKELIKYKGFQVAPAELEALLVTHPAVADAAVVGIPDEEAGEIPKAFVVLKPGAEATAEEICAHVADQVAHFKQIREVAFVEEIPKSASGKILRRMLRDQG